MRGSGPEEDGDRLQVSVPGPLERHWFDTHIRRRVEEAVVACGHPTMRIQFVITHRARTSPLTGSRKAIPHQ